MSQFEAPEARWVELHRDELISATTEAAVELVQAAGFRPIVKVPQPDVAFAAAYWNGSVSLVCIDGIVRRVSAG